MIGRRSPWYIAPTDKVVWSVESMPVSRHAFKLFLCMKILVNGKTLITSAAIDRHDTRNMDNAMFAISMMAREFLKFRDLDNNPRFKHTANWSYNDYAKARRRS